MKKIVFLVISFLLISYNSQAQNKTIKYDYLWINGGIGAGGVISTNIINSGAVLPAFMEIAVQDGRCRYGIGVAHELYLTPENLGKLVLGNSSNTEKVYFTFEGMLIPNFFINLGVCAQVGGFLVGNDIDKANQAEGKDVPKYNFFGNGGLVAEIGIRPVFIFVKPYIEYKNYGGWHKEIIGAVTLGIKLKLKQK